MCEFGTLAATLATALADSTHGPAYKLAASTESHCGLCQVFVQERLQATGGKAVGPIALCKIPLPLPPEPGSNSDDSSSSREAAVPTDAGADAAAGAGGGAAAARAGADPAAGAAAVGAAGSGKPRAFPYYLYVAGGCYSCLLATKAALMVLQPHYVFNGRRCLVFLFTVTHHATQRLVFDEGVVLAALQAATWSHPWPAM